VRYFQALDPRRSLATAVAWLAVAVSLATAAALLGVGAFAVNSMLAQRDALMRRFAVQLAEALDRAYAEALAARHAGADAVEAPEVSADMAAGGRLGVVVDAVRARVKPDPRARMLLLDERHQIVFERPASTAPGMPITLPATSSVDPDHRVVVFTAPQDASPTLRALGLQVAVAQPSEERGRGGSLEEKLTAISILLSIGAALLGAGFARRLTRRLSGLTTQVKRVARQQSTGIVEPAGRDEVAILGRAFGRLLDDLHRERDELDQLTHELEQRVQARTREVERLAADSRYAAVARERLRMARDLHDTLAHSMMEMLVEVRTLRTLHARDPAALARELERAEELARQGLHEARDAVSQMRMNAVRDLGLAMALRSTVNRFAERTGLEVQFTADTQAASFADARAEAVFRIAQEALRNIEQHANAAHVDVRLEDLAGGMLQLTIADDGAGFDPAAPHPGHYGVIGLHEQAQLIDAELEVLSAPGEGSTVRLRMPVAAATAPRSDHSERLAHG
jgi:signal transduction histidine kinase